MIKTEHFTGDYGVLLHSLANIAKKYQIEKYDIVEPEAEDWVWDLTVVFDDEKPYVYMYGSDNYDILSEEEKIPLYIAKERGWKNKKLGKPYLEEKTVIMGSYMDVWKEEVTRLNEFYDLEENW